MKKIILFGVGYALFLSIIALFLPVVRVDAQSKPNCQEIFDRDLYKCLTESTVCINSCVDKANSVGSLTVDAGKVNLECQRNTCDPAKEACDKRVKENFKACTDSRKAREATSSEIDPTAKMGLDDKPSLPVFIGEWFKKFSQATEAMLALPEIFIDIAYEDKLNLAPDLPTFEEVFANIGAPPSLSPDRYASISLNGAKANNPDKVILLGGTGSDYVLINRGGQYTRLAPGEEVPYGSTLSVERPSLFQAGDHMFEVKPLPGQPNAIFHIRKNINENRVEIEPLLNSGEIEVYRPGPKGEKYQEFLPLILETPEAKVSSKQTHYSVSRNRNKKATLVKTYEGEVKIATEDGEPVSIFPGKVSPGIAVIRKELSIPGLTTLIIAVLVTISAILMFVKRKRS